MNRITKLSLSLLKFSALGFILIYIVAIIMVGAAGHSSGDIASFTGIFAYSIFLFFLIGRYQKSLSLVRKSGKTIKILLLILLIPIIGLCCLFIYKLLTDEKGYLGISIFLLLILFTFVTSGITVVKELIVDKSNK